MKAIAEILEREIEIETDKIRKIQDVQERITNIQMFIRAWDIVEMTDEEILYQIKEESDVRDNIIIKIKGVHNVQSM